MKIEDGSVEQYHSPRAKSRQAPFNARSFRAVQKSPSSKATAIFARGTYMQYVSTEKWRERR